MPYPLPLTRTEAYLAYKAGVIQQSDLKPSLAIPRNGIDAWLAYWTGLAADYPKREDGTPHILQEEEAYIAYLCGVINEYPEKCLRRVGAYLRYLISARWGRPDHPLNREELYLSLIKTQFIPSGDPSSDIVIDGTAKAAFVDVKMYGDTFQQTYTGKNLVGIDGITFPFTTNGVTVTREQDGSYTFNGTTTGVTNFVLSPYSNRETYDSLVTYDGQNVTLSLATSGTMQATQSTSAPAARNYGIKTWSGDDVFVATNNGTNFSPSRSGTLNMGSYTDAYLGVRVSNGVIMQNFNMKIQLELGSTATSYEPFVGGQPSPSPEYPQPIQTVTGLQTVEVQGKNLLKLNDGTTTLSGVAIATTNGTVNLKGAATSGVQGYYVTIGMTASEPMVFSPNKSGTTSGLDIKLQYKRGGTIYYPSVGSSLSLQAGDIIQQMYLIISNGSVLDGSFSPMLEKGSTKTSFEPYSKQTYEIDLNCNIYDKSQSYKDAYDIRIPIAINPGSKYVFSAPTSWVGVYLYDSSGNFTRTIGHTQSTRSGEFTAGSNEVKAIFTFYAGSEVTWSWSDIKFYDVAGVIKLCGLDNYQDYIYEDGNDWKVHKEIGEVTLDGSETWTKATANSGYRFWTGKAADIKTSVDAVLKANRLGVAQGDTWDNYGISGSYSTNPIRLYIRDELFNDMTEEQLRSWLATHNIIAYYALATPTDTVITNQKLINQLNALKQGGAENDTTYIKVNATDTNLPGLLYVEAPKYE